MEGDYVVRDDILLGATRLASGEYLKMFPADILPFFRPRSRECFCLVGPNETDYSRYPFHTLYNDQVGSFQ